jgi:predicted amidophosphoribosyltransferase
MASTTLTACPDCQQLVSRLAEACPSCGRPLQPPRSREGLFLRTLNSAVLLAIVGPLFILAILVAVALVARVFFFR